MKYLTINPGDFRVKMHEKSKLYSIYGNQYVDILREMEEKLARTLNSSNFFSEIVDKRLYDKNIQNAALEEIQLQLLVKLYNFDNQTIEKIGDAKTINDIYDRDVLEKINKILDDPKEKTIFEIYYSITRLLFNDYIYCFLKNYISSKEPLLSNYIEVKDIPECDFIIERYHQFIDSLNIDANPIAPTIDENGCVIIRQGDLFHGTMYSEDVIESIASKGLESGQLHGIEEEGATFYCLDFWKATRDSTADEICFFGRDFTNGPNQIVFVINHLNLEGPEAMFPNLTDYDVYNENTERGKEARKILDVDRLPYDYSIRSAILMGVPPCMISSIIVNHEIENNPQKIEFLSSSFPKATIVSRSNGMIIKNPEKPNQKDKSSQKRLVRERKQNKEGQ